MAYYFDSLNRANAGAWGAFSDGSQSWVSGGGDSIVSNRGRLTPPSPSSFAFADAQSQCDTNSMSASMDIATFNNVGGSLTYYIGISHDNADTNAMAVGYDGNSLQLNTYVDGNIGSPVVVGSLVGKRLGLFYREAGNLLAATVDGVVVVSTTSSTQPVGSGKRGVQLACVDSSTSSYVEIDNFSYSDYVELSGQSIAVSQGIVTTTVAATPTSVAETRNHPGRGPYSLGRLFRPSVDAFTDRNVTITLNGQVITSTHGTATPVHAIGVAGQVIVFTPGSVTTGSDVGVALSGQAIVFATGSLGDFKSVSLTGSEVGISLGSITITNTAPGGDAFVVASYLGLQIQIAGFLAYDAGFGNVQTAKRKTPYIPVGTVINQSPSPGGTAVPGQLITFEVADGTIPSFTYDFQNIPPG